MFSSSFRDTASRNHRLSSGAPIMSHPTNPHALVMLGTLVQIDNTSPQIQYQGAWQMTTTPGEGDAEDTLASSQTKSDTAIFNFTGTSVAVYGALKPVGTWNMQSLYYMDDAAVVTYQPNSQVPAEQHQVVFYFSESLGDGPHTLRIVNMGEQFWLDFIALETPDAGTTQAGSSLPSSGPTAIDPGSPSLSTSFPLTVTTTLISTASSTASPSTISKPAVIAGIAAGAVLLGILSVAAFLYARRRPARRPETTNAGSVVDLLGSPSRTTDIQPPSTRQSAMSQNPLTISPSHTSLLVSAPNTSSLFVEDSFSEGGGGRRPGERMEYHRPFVTQGRSVDGGVRLKGGPPGHNMNIDNPPSEVGFNHADSLLPPLYQMHPSE
ncbi:hypothetical protein VTO73DRAFT_1056 [Trametes versicolor]